VRENYNIFPDTLFFNKQTQFSKSQMNVSNIITRNYKNFIPLAGYKNKPNSNPIRACPELVPKVRSRMGQFQYKKSWPKAKLLI
jgi:hypothetical protein